MSLDSMFLPINMSRCQTGVVELDTQVNNNEAHIAFDHLYARSADDPGGSLDTTVKTLNVALAECRKELETLKKQNQTMRGLILLNMDMIQQQNVVIVNKERSSTLLQKQYLDLKVKLMTLEDHQVCGNCNQLLKQRNSMSGLLSKLHDIPIEMNGRTISPLSSLDRERLPNFNEAAGPVSLTCDKESRISKSNGKVSRNNSLLCRRGNDSVTKENNPLFSHQNKAIAVESRDERHNSFHVDRDQENDESFSERSFKVNRKSRTVHTYSNSKNKMSYLFSDNEVLHPSSPEAHDDREPTFFPSSVSNSLRQVSNTPDLYLKRQAAWDEHSEMSVQSQDRLFSPEHNESSNDSEMMQIMDWNSKYSVKRPRIETCGDFSYGQSLLNFVPAHRFCELHLKETALLDSDIDELQHSDLPRPKTAETGVRRIAHIEIRKSYERKKSKPPVVPHIIERQRAKSCSTSPFSNSTKLKRMEEEMRRSDLRDDLELRKSEEPQDLSLSTVRRRTKSLCTPPPTKMSQLTKLIQTRSRRRRKKQWKAMKSHENSQCQLMIVDKPMYTPQGDAGASWYCGIDANIENCFGTNLEGVAAPSKVASEAEVQIPRWRVMQLSGTSDSEGTEDLDDKVFLKRHMKHEINEQRVKKYDIRMAREQRRIEKLKKRHQDTIEASGSEDRVSFLPQPRLDMQFIQLTEDLPVNAFGENVIKLPEEQFDLPWRKNPKQSHRSKTRKKHR